LTDQISTFSNSILGPATGTGLGVAPWWPFVSLNSSVSRTAFGSLPLVANITDATGFTNPLLLPFQLCTPLGLAYGWLCGASYDHQTDYPYESN
jgi:hypothetical protein